MRKVNERLDNSRPDPNFPFEFEKKTGRKIEEIDTSQFMGKRLRGELLVYLKDLCGLKYSQIAEIDFFRELKFNSLGNLYGAAKKRLQGQKLKK